jgi:hypothetical protein
MRYAVDMQPGRFTGWKSDSPAAAWYFLFFFTKNVAQREFFCEKDRASSALPEAISTSGEGTA